MNLFAAFRMALETLGENKLRTGLTLLGITIGVFAIIVSVTAVRVIEVYFEESLQFLGSSTFTISRSPLIQIDGGDRSLRNRPNLTYEQVKLLDRAMTLPVWVSPFEPFYVGAVRYEDRETNPNIALIGSNEQYLGNFSLELAQGRFFTQADVQLGRPVIVLGPGMAEELFPNETPLGKKVRLDGHRYEVLGVLKPKGNVFGFERDNRAIAPITRLYAIYGQPQRNITTVSVRVQHPYQFEVAMQEVIGRLRMIRKVPPGEENNFEIDTNTSMRSIFTSFTRTLALGGAGIGLVALLAAGIGIMNIMLVSVTERTREIGIRKSLGARRRDIMRQFLIEAFVLCQFGALVGVVLGVVGGNTVAFYFGITAAFPWEWAAGSIVIVIVVALLFGVYPAYKAAHLDPIEALGYE